MLSPLQARRHPRPGTHVRPTGPERERANGLDRADIILLAKDDADENVANSAYAYGNISE